MSTEAKGHEKSHPRRAQSPLSGATVLVGAGISFDSGLPDAESLAMRALDLVTESSPILLADAELSRLREHVKNLRLEILLERLATEVPKEFLFSVFECLRDASPNFNHIALMGLEPGSVVTTNQDLLLESAAGLLGLESSVLHLHGRCNDKHSIITTISQYLAGLLPAVAAQFRRVLDGADVVVLGYSGRDRDVMPVLAEGAMKSVTWLHHPGGEKSPELRRLKEQLRGRMQVTVGDAKEWLRERLTGAALREVEAAAGRLPVRPVGGCKTAPRRFSRLTPLDANLAVGRMLEHVGHYNAAFNCYRRLLRCVDRAGATESYTRVQLAIGRVQTFQYQFGRAYRRYARIARDGETLVVYRCQALADSVAVLRNSSNYKGALRCLGQLEGLLPTAPASGTFQKLRGEAAAHRAGMLRLVGDARGSIEFYRKADKYFRSARDVDGWIEVSTWLADNLLTLGQFRDAATYLKSAINDADAYGSYFSKVWSLFLRGELLGFGGNVAAALKVIARAYDYFEKINNPQGQVYALLYASDFARERSLTEAAHSLKHAGKLLRKHNFVFAHGRFLLQRAELSRARGRPAEVRKYLGLLESNLNDKLRFATPPHLLIAHSKLVAAEQARELNSPAAPALLLTARDLYARLEANYGSTRIDVARWLMAPTEAERARLLSVCRQEGYGHELRRLQNPAPGHYPLHLV